MLQNKNVLTKQNEENSPTKIYQNKFIFKKFRIIQKISDGTFGKIYRVVNPQGKYFAMKTERNDSKFHLLEQEAFNLLEIKGGTGIPKLISFGKTKNYSLLIEEYLPKSLSDLFLYNRDKLTIRDKCLIAIQLIERIEYLHSKTLVHRDIKPDNFLIGLEDPNLIYLSEFRFCTKFKSSKTGKHIIPGFRGTFTGTLRFSSANAQRGMQQSRRDDLESIGYVILLFFKGKLPWDLGESTDLTLSEKDVYLKTYKKKKFMQTNILCKGCPNELEEYFKYVRSLKFEEDPDYQKMRDFFIDIIKKEENTIEENININSLTFTWAKLNENSRSKSKKKNGVKSRLYKKFIKRFENNKLREKTFETNNSLEKEENFQNIMKASTEFRQKDYSLTQGNQMNNFNNLNKNIQNNTKNILNKKTSLEDKKRINKQKYINSKIIYMTNGQINQNSNNNNNVNYQIINKPSLMTKETNKINPNKSANVKRNNYLKINNTNIPGNNKRNINNLNIQKKKLNLNININNNIINSNNNISSTNKRHINIAQNIKPMSNNLNNKIIRRTINNNLKGNLTATNIENQYKPIFAENKNKILKQNVNYNNIYHNSNSNQKNLQNNYPLNQYQTYSNDKNHINGNIFNNINDRNILYS